MLGILVRPILSKDFHPKISIQTPKGPQGEASGFNTCPMWSFSHFDMTSQLLGRIASNVLVLSNFTFYACSLANSSGANKRL